MRMKLRIEKDSEAAEKGLLPWRVCAPAGFEFGPDKTIGRMFRCSRRVFESFDAARQYVADGRAQRALEPAT